jgi:hypothetical protein
VKLTELAGRAGSRVCSVCGTHEISGLVIVVCDPCGEYEDECTCPVEGSRINGKKKTD